MPDFILTAPPPGVNRSYANRKFKTKRGTNFGRVKTAGYKAWIKGEMNSLLAQRARPVPWPVEITVILPQDCNLDSDAPLKACVDLMVKGGIIPNDGKRFVLKSSSQHSEQDQMIVRVESVSPPPAKGREPGRVG